MKTELRPVELKSPRSGFYLPRTCVESFEEGDYDSTYIVWFPLHNYPPEGIVVHCGNLVSPEEAVLGQVRDDFLDEGSLDDLFVRLPKGFELKMTQE